MAVFGQSVGNQGAPKGFVGGIVDKLVNKPVVPPQQGGIQGMINRSKALTPPSPGQQVAAQTGITGFNDPTAALKARALYSLGVRRSDNPAVDAEMQTLAQNPPATPLQNLGKGLLVAGTVNRLLQ